MMKTKVAAPVTTATPDFGGAPVERPRANGGLKKALRAASSWYGILTVLLAWQFFGWVMDAPWLPPVSDVVRTLWELFAAGVIQPHLAASLTSLVIGFTIALVGGLLIGTLMGLSTTISTALDVYVNAMLFTPALAFAPILFAIFGLSDATRISVVVMYAMFIIIINTATAVRNVDDVLLDMAASFGAPKIMAIRRIVIPSAYPLIIAGIRLGAGRAVKGMINGEMFIALVGLGGLSSRFGKSLEFEKVWAMALFIMIIAVLINQAVSALEKRLTSWYD